MSAAVARRNDLRRLRLRSPHDSAAGVSSRRGHAAARTVAKMGYPWDSASGEGGRMLGAGADGDQARAQRLLLSYSGATDSAQLRKPPSPQPVRSATNVY